MYATPGPGRLSAQLFRLAVPLPHVVVRRTPCDKSLTRRAKTRLGQSDALRCCLIEWHERLLRTTLPRITRSAPFPPASRQQ
jgi:hypothetical protein